MSSTELDMPLIPSADQVRRREFVTVRRGYDPDQVRAYLKQVGDQIESLEEEVRVAKAENAAAAQANAQSEAEVDVTTSRVKEDAYTELSERMADMLRTAEGHAATVGREAEEERNKMLAEARSEADRIRIDSQEKAEQTRQEANDVMRTSRDEADRMLTGLDSRRDALVAELEEMRERLLTMAQSIGAIAEHEQGAPDSAGPPSVPGIAPAQVGSSLPSDFSVDEILSDPQFAELWAEEPDPLADIPTLSLEDIEPEDPSI